MARRKRSLRGLGGSPVHHAREARYKAQRVVEGGKTINRGSGIEAILESGNCRDAYFQMIGLWGSKEAASVHTDEYRESASPKPDVMESLYKANDKAHKAIHEFNDAFMAKCLVGGGLSGLGRRPRRRR